MGEYISSRCHFAKGTLSSPRGRAPLNGGYVVRDGTGLPSAFSHGQSAKSGHRQVDPARRTAAFFDVDETLITAKSMFEFLRYWLARNGDDGALFQRKADALRAMAGRGPREEGNRAYYSNFAGVPAAGLMEAGRDWYAAYRSGPEAFVAATVRALARHQAAGDRIALVSGGFAACLRPLADDFAVDLVLCSDPVIGAEGVLTGEIGTAMIGKAKAVAVARAIAEFDLSTADCWAYGDHSSDLGMLSSVGNPVVIGDDPVLRAYVRDHGGSALPATAGDRDGLRLSNA
ncbi:HAD-IB family hydrolase [Streptomyces sp. NPDC050610]|uniref:HAD family hydrolase n=1 Tax=Streptomyces sp. NPDC050610 TaxID=3157097 RepID=UPI00343D50F3